MITFKNFSYKYINSDKLNIDDFNVVINKGECVLFTGNSGCGKTTLLRLLNGLAPEFFEGGYAGELKVAHLTIGDKLKDFSKIVGSVFQNPKNQFFNLDSTSELAFSMENYGCRREEIEKRIIEISEEFNAQHLLDRNILTLSGGEKQRLAFMASMMLDADIYVLDEITSNLDLKSIKLVSEIITKLKEKGKTIIIAEHRIYYLRNIIDKMYIIRDGKILRSVDKNELQQFDGSQCKTRQIDLKFVALNEKNIKTAKNNLTINKLSYKVNENIINIENENFTTNKVYAIVGDNGCGKTTFANALSGLIKSKSDIVLNNEKLKNKQLVKYTFQVMQDVNYQLFTNNVEKEIKLGSKDLTNFDNIVDRLKIRKFLERHPNTLSGGEKQRVAIASALVSDKKILIFDEPTSGLDYINMIELSKLIREINEKDDLIIFIITHDYEFLSTVADEVIYFNNDGIKERVTVTKKNSEKILNMMGISDLE